MVVVGANDSAGDAAGGGSGSADAVGAVGSAVHGAQQDLDCLSGLLQW